MTSVQLYTVREWLNEDAAATLDRIRQIGYAEVEPFSIGDYPNLPQQLRDAGLAAPTAHGLFLTGNADELFAAAASLGAHTIIDTHVPEHRWQTRAGVEGIARDLNAAAVQATKFGLSVAYHNHAFEFTTLIDGQTAWEVFVAGLDATVRLQIDTYWVGAAGLDPVGLVRSGVDRVVAMHLKDGPYTHDDHDQLPLGEGRLPVVELIEAAPNALRVVELDDYRGDRFEAIETSLKYLEEKGLA